MYIPIIKLSEAELRAVENINVNSDQFIPLIEITRGRKHTQEMVKASSVVTYPFENRLKKIKKIFNGKSIAFDLTSDISLLSTEVVELYNPNDGYYNWLTFLTKISDEKVFKEIIPSIIFNWDDKDFEVNFKSQIEALAFNFDKLIYRTPLQTQECYEELPLILKYLPSKTELYLLIDGGYLQEGIVENAIDVFKARISNIKSIDQNRQRKVNIIISSTSFPNNVTEYGDKETDQICLSEKIIYNAVLKEHQDVIYSDYATINPTRNDNITMARGWIPRIDVPTEKEIFYYRIRRPKGISAYKGAYILAADSVIKDKRFPKELKKNWGIQMIETCADGIVPGSNPSFWISVRMNIHIAQICKWLRLECAST